MKKILATAALALAIATGAQAAETGSTIYGYLGYDAGDELSPGLYTVDLDGNLNRKWSYSLADQGPTLAAGWLKGTTLCALSVMSMSGDQMLTYYSYQELDFATGKILKSETVDSDSNKASIFVTAAYVPQENRIYGYSMNPEGNGYAFTSAIADKPGEAQVIKLLDFAGERCYSFCYNPDDDSFYGVNTTGAFVKVDRQGNSTPLLETGLDKLANTRGALTFSPYDGCFIWNPQFYGEKSALYAIDPDRHQVSRLHSFAVDRQFTFFLTTDSKTTAASPAKPAVKNVAFTLGSYEAEVTYTMPSTRVDATPLDGSLSWTAMVNGTVKSTGTASPGTDVKVDYKPLAQGECALQMQVTTAAGEVSPMSVVKVYAGNDVPLAPGNVTLTADKITWDAVTSGVHDAYLELSALRYKVWVNDNLVAVTSATECNASLDPEKDFTAYTAKVIAECNGVESAPSLSNRLLYGKPFDMPYTFVPTPEQAELVTIYNNDGGPDFGVWTYTDRWDRPCFTSGWSMNVNADDWLILPAMNFTQCENVYELTLDAAQGGYSGREHFEVWAGTSPDPASMTIPVIAKTRTKSMEWTEYSNVFAVPSAGTYYVAVRGVSDPDQYALIVSNITVKATDLKSTMPSAPGSLRCVAASDADLTATISFKLPTTNLIGETLPAGTLLTATATCVNSASVTGEPGSTRQLTVSTAQGENIIKIYCELDGLKGKTAEILVFTGVDLPGYVENFSAEVAEDNMSVHYTWEPPVESLYGGYYTPQGVTYQIGLMDTDGSFLSDPAEVVGKLDYTFTIPERTPQQSVRVGIAAVNAAGVSPARWYIASVVGTPYKVPIHETFDDITTHYDPIVINRPTDDYTNGGWTFCQPELVDPSFANTSPYAIIGYTNADKARVRLSLPKFTTKNVENPVATFELWTGNGAATASILATTYGMTSPELIANVPSGSGWSFVEVPLPDKFKNRGWVTLSIDGALGSSSTYLIMSSYQITDGSVLALDSVEESTASITAGVGSIEVSNLAGERVTVHTIDGKTIKVVDITSPSQRIAVAPGLYIVNSPSIVTKLRVK